MSSGAFDLLSLDKRSWPAPKKAAREARIIVFIDESGVSERPHRVRSWAPKGQTLVLQYSFTWKQLSAVAGISFWTSTSS
jgi:hypothetical protein